MRSDTEQLGFSLQPKNDEALNEWNINLFGFSDCPLAEVGKMLGIEVTTIPASREIKEWACHVTLEELSTFKIVRAESFSHQSSFILIARLTSGVRR